MAHLSRSFQVVLAAFALFVALWFAALRAHNSSTSSAGPRASTSRATTAHAKATRAVKHPVTAAKPATKPVTGNASSAPSTPPAQSEVEHELVEGKTVLILFWTPSGAEDVAVHNELPAVQRKLGGKVAVHYATASQVGGYGAVTRAVQITQTPTLLIVNPHGQVTTLTGLTDAFAIEQAISEAGG